MSNGISRSCVLKDYAKIVDGYSAHLGNLAGKRVLEVGASVNGGGMAVHLAARGADATGINIVGKAKVFGPNARLEIRDICNSGFESDSFDYVVSHAAFEHVSYFDRAIAEIFRILRPGGKLVSSFGPIWSCKWGHHLWVKIDGQAYNFQTCILPSYCHLMMDQDEIASAAFDVTGNRRAADAVADYVVNSSEQNRLMYCQYKRIIAASGFVIEEWRGHNNPVLEGRYPEPTPQQSRYLSDRYGPDEELSVAGISMVLLK
jgi:SAM-dependent methyltransferase